MGRGEKHQPGTSNSSKANSELCSLLSRAYSTWIGFYGWGPLLASLLKLKLRKDIFFDQWPLWKSDEFLAFYLEKKNAGKVQTLQKNSRGFVDQCPSH